MPHAPLAINALPAQSNPQVVIELSRIFAAHGNVPPAEREAAFLEAQFPAILQPIGSGDLLAGRRAYAAVAFDPDMMGGYACNEGAMQDLLTSGVLKSGQQQALEQAQSFWRVHSTPARIRAAFSESVQAALPEDGHLKAVCAAYPLYRQAGTTLNYGQLVRLGLPGLRAAVDERIQQSGGDPAFLSACLRALTVLDRCLDHYRLQASDSVADNDCERLRKMADACAALRERAPQTVFEALQLIWLYALISSSQNFGRLDDVLAPLLQSERARIGEERADAEALDALCGFWRLADEELNLMNARVVIGGVGRDDPASADAVALLMIEAARRTRVTRPQLSLRWHEALNPVVWDAALACIAEGTTFPILYSDPVNVPGVGQAFGVDAATAVDYVPYGCGEYVLGSASLNSPNGIINLLKCLELALFNGVDPRTQRRLGPATGEWQQLQTFEDLWQAYCQQVEFLTDALAKAHREQDEVCKDEFSGLLISLLLDDCLTRGRSFVDGGVRHQGGLLESYGNTNAAESLTAIKRVVYEDPLVNLAELRQAMCENFANHPELRQALLKAPKYGNDDPIADAMVMRVHDHICDACRRGGGAAELPYYLPVMINNWNNTAQGYACIASADGRLHDEPLVSGNGALPGADRDGPTALALSLAKPACNAHAGSVQNMKFDANLFRRHRQKLKALLETYFLQGGSQAMLTVVSREDLLDAMEHPERHGDLLVRIGGFSARFVSLPKAVQLEVIARTMH